MRAVSGVDGGLGTLSRVVAGGVCAPRTGFWGGFGLKTLCWSLSGPSLSGQCLLKGEKKGRGFFAAGFMSNSAYMYSGTEIGNKKSM